jgi:Tol biopolymer transport system component
MRSEPRSQGARWTRRRFLGVALALGTVTWGASWRPGYAADAPGGLILLPRGRDIALIKPDGSDDRTIVTLQTGEFIADAALSPDRSKVAFGMFTARTGDGPGGSDIVVAPVDAPDQRTIVVPRDRPGMLLAAPQWSPDGQALVFEGVGLSATGQASVTAEWVSADGSGRRVLAQQGRYPSFSPDGRSVVYTKALPTGDALWEVPLDGGDAREIVPDSVLLLIAYPRYSPDGKTIAVAGVGDTPTVPAAPAVPIAPSRAAPKLILPSDSQDPSTSRSVAAHGYPAEPFAIPPGGGEPHRMASLPIDDAAVAWSPDGAWVAVSGANGLFLVNVADGSARRVSENGSFGAIDWR